MSDTTTAPATEPTHTWLITLQYPVHNGYAVVTHNGSITAAPGGNRERAYLDIRDWLTEQRPELGRGNVLFFSLEPYRL
ncbi:hypothetical protein GCM10018790_01620 [Kitasatospora xanthocidica]|uniref:hypothetical protein n=1 Tax=Kitasatospora xanthocidica TaxID=83382 RepID=UPI0016767748|nr:hypothetical protein [Kitasatospora xanthocidica]GHF27908.1 hypothetical protein GCM10018790_01620 [Kitasatospora xanthocidica]